MLRRKVIVMLLAITALTTLLLTAPSDFETRAASQPRQTDQEKKKILEDLQKSRKIDKQLLEPVRPNFVHCIIKYTEHNGFNITSGGYTLRLSVNGNEIGSVRVDAGTKPDTPGDVTVEGKYLISPLLTAGSNQINVKGHIEGIVNHPWISASMEITYDGITSVRKDYRAEGLFFWDSNARKDFTDTVTIQW